MKMKKCFTLQAMLCLSVFSYAQCTISGFDVCTDQTPSISFRNATLVSGTPLASGSKYKFNHAASIGPVSLDAIVSVDLTSNAVLISIDDDAAADETGVPGSQAALFSPRI